jgi:hypothetical protein
LQKLERHRYRESRNDQAPRIFPFRTFARRCPIVSIDQLVFVAAKDMVTSFNPNDLYVNNTSDYIEVLAYAIGNYALLGELEVIGYSANVYELSYTSGYPMASYPAEVREATMMIATKMLKQRNLAAMGMGDVQKFENKLTLVTDQSIPEEARRLLMPYVSTGMG